MYNIKVLLVEDDERISKIVETYLSKENYDITVAANGEEAFAALEYNEFHAVLLDVMLPDTDGWSILRRIRKKGATPVIMLTAREAEEDKLMGFELGADDYITKPFSLKELLARVKALLKRSNVLSANVELSINGLKIQRDYRQVFADGERLALSPIEFSLLLYFVDNINIALTRDQILNVVWGNDYFGDERTVDTHIKRLRQKLGPKEGAAIETIRSFGYRMVQYE
ncbi:MAG: response regulator transcription factor [Christensenellaceae bacterium]|nr:response regulator transcription factor [Christensenellaceae bacterium]